MVREGRCSITEVEQAERKQAEKAADGDWTVGEEPRCLCRLLPITYATIGVGIVEFVLLCHSLIFTYSNYFAGEAQYRHYNPVFAAVIKHYYLLPFLIIQMLWFVSNILMLVGIKTDLPFLVLPRIFIQSVGIMSLVCLIVLAYMNLTITHTSANWELIVSLSLCVAITFAEIYFLYFVVWRCYKYLKHMRVAVSNERKWLRPISALADRARSATIASRLNRLNIATVEALPIQCNISNNDNSNSNTSGPVPIAPVVLPTSIATK